MQAESVSPNDQTQESSENSPTKVTAPTPGPISPSIAATAPGQIRVIKRNGTVVPYAEDKIAVAITKAFLAVEGGTAAASPRIRELVAGLAGQVSSIFMRRLPSGGTIHIEDVQDQVELALMRSGEHKVARTYVLYREERARAREGEGVNPTTEKPIAITVVRRDGDRVALDMDRIRTLVTEACEGLEDVDAHRILTESLSNMYDGISEVDVATSLLITARTLVEEEPNYTFVTARLLLDQLRTETLEFLDVRSQGQEDYQATHSQMLDTYGKAFQAFIHRGIELELLAPELEPVSYTHLRAHET